MDRIDQDQDSAADLKRKLGKRLGLAAVLIVVLLGALAMFDRLSTLEREEAAKTEVAPVQPRLGPSISTGRPPEPALPAEEPITPSPALAPKQTPAAIDPPPKPEIPAQPTITPPAPVSAKPLPPVAVPAPAAKPAPINTTAPAASAVPVASTAKPPATRPTSPLPSAATSVAPEAPVSPIAIPKAPVAASVPEGSSSSPMLGSSAPAAPAAPVRLPVPASAPTTAARPALSRLIDGFVLQAGVFASTERAEELKAKLLMAGVPVTIESRVQVGPFKTQKEADAARKKIRELGIDSILIPPRSSRR